MKLAFLFSVAAVASALIACSSSSGDSTDQSTSSEDLSSTAVKCPAGQKVCEVITTKGICKNECVPDTVMCVKPVCRICDPSSAAPRPACHWDTTTCDWDCPVCDPVGAAPRPVCHWDTEKCDWECPVCDPSGPAPNPSCKWDTKACVWLCL